MVDPARILSILSLDQYGVRFGDRVILAAVDLEVPPTGPFVLMGPVSTGKSTLLRSLAGFNDANPAFASWGRAIYAGAELDDGPRPALIAQNARLVMSTVAQNLVHNHPDRRHLSPRDQRDLAAQLCIDHGIPEYRAYLDDTVIDRSLAEQRMISLIRLIAADPPLICLDEPTSHIGDAEAEFILQQIQYEAERRAVLVVVHNQRHAYQLGGQAALLAGGCIVESRATRCLLDEPESELGRRFVRTGTCQVPSPDADPMTLADDAPTPFGVPVRAAPPVPVESRGPSGFLWLHAGRLAGTPMPGVFHPVEYDTDALVRMGVTVLVSLTQVEPDIAALAARGLRVHRSPVPDMCAPSVTQAWGLCSWIEEQLTAGEVVAVHCRAGKGRTGAILASYLIWEGSDPLDALEAVRHIDARWVQSDEQVRFLERFAEVVRRRNGSTPITDQPQAHQTARLRTPRGDVCERC